MKNRMILFNKLILIVFSSALIGASIKPATAPEKSHLYEIPMNTAITAAELLPADQAFFDSLTRAYGYRDSVIVYSLTNLKVIRDGKPYEHRVYRNRNDLSQLLIDLKSIDAKSHIVVANRRKNTIGWPGTGGISYHPSATGNHILCLNGPGNTEGVPIDDEKAGFPTPEFTSTAISWYFY